MGIARSLANGGQLWCVDPWPEDRGLENPCFSIFRRHVSRSGVEGRVRIVRESSGAVTDQLPFELDFAFIDGDHSWAGVDTDWQLVSPRIVSGGYVCLHDSVVPPGEPWRRGLESNRYFDDVIRADNRFHVEETVHSLAVLRRL